MAPTPHAVTAAPAPEAIQQHGYSAGTSRSHPFFPVVQVIGLQCAVLVKGGLLAGDLASTRRTAAPGRPPRATKRGQVPIWRV